MHFSDFVFSTALAAVVSALHLEERSRCAGAQQKVPEPDPELAMHERRTGMHQRPVGTVRWATNCSLTLPPDCNAPHCHW
jgi:hypothetical protein